MKTLESSTRDCMAEGRKGSSDAGMPIWAYLLIGVLAVTAWWMIYSRLHPFASFLTYSVLGIGKDTHLGSALAFFFYDTPKVMMLLLLVVFGVGSPLQMQPSYGTCDDAFAAGGLWRGHHPQLFHP